ncbi:hypothetical protein Cha6605_1703 [Chamaesiphon minutus PCC 6605]|uniref:Transposase n=1 Tax=Chamaesiphon minutus (strain ATCC 27169 / PCC 6605) TaxID=1173020 RepID=K9UF63_CHAP6|nr:hypothetical protein Cha6605_1703 [Chamaesiphon minutus PCC 6605]
MKRHQPFKWCHFLPDVILLNVRWYCRYALSYWDLEEMMLERGVEVDHTTLFISINFLTRIHHFTRRALIVH